MKPLNKILLFGLLILVAKLPAGTGTSGAQFLQLGSGSRSMALGGAFAAISEGIESVYINPAGLARLGQREVLFTHSELYADLNYENVALALPLPFGSVAISAVAFLSGKIEETTIDQPDGTGSTFSANDYSLNVSYSRRMTDKFSAGGTFKLLFLNLADVQASGIAFDFGATYNTGLKNLRVGFAINNFGPDLRYSGDPLKFTTRKEENPEQASDVNAQFVSEQFILPLTFRVGFAYDVLNGANNRLTIVADGLNPNDQEEHLAVGAEYQFQQKYSLRIGHAGGINNKGLTAGAGAILPLGTSSLRIDYSFEDHEFLSSVSRFSIGFAF